MGVHSKWGEGETRDVHEPIHLLFAVGNGLHSDTNRWRLLVKDWRVRD
jgi:hypothetical protein